MPCLAAVLLHMVLLLPGVLFSCKPRHLSSLTTDIPFSNKLAQIPKLEMEPSQVIHDHPVLCQLSFTCNSLLPVHMLWKTTNNRVNFSNKRANTKCLTHSRYSKYFQMNEWELNFKSQSITVCTISPVIYPQQFS
jgi:hypothetical protein